MRTGHRLAKRYTLDERIASGGITDVWRARDEVLGREVAIKLLHPHLAVDEDVLDRFRRGAIAAARLSHPAVARVYDTGVEGDDCYIVVELHDGDTLADVLARRGPLPPEDAADIARGILEGLAHAHDRGVIHRDVRPANVLVSGALMKLADFAIAEAAVGGDPTATRELVGTSAYLAPEQAAGDRADHRADLYAVGVVLHELLVGRPPSDGRRPDGATSEPVPPGRLRAGIPRGLDALVLRALAPDPADRFQSAEEMRAALERWAIEAALPELLLDEAVRRHASFFRSWMLVPLLILALGAASVAVGLLVGRLELGGPLGVRPAGPQAPAPQDRALPIASVTDLDPPPGDRDEHGAEAPLAADGDLATFWQTEGYASPDLGGLKPGVGLVLDLGAAREVLAIDLATPNPGWAFELRTSRDGAALGEPLPDASGATSYVAAEATEVRLPPTSTRYLVVWITSLTPAEDGTYRAIVSEVAVRGG